MRLWAVLIILEVAVCFGGVCYFWYDQIWNQSLGNDFSGWAMLVLSSGGIFICSMLIAAQLTPRGWKPKGFYEANENWKQTGKWS